MLGGARVSFCYLFLVTSRLAKGIYRAPMALLRASTVSTGAGVLAFGVTTLEVLVVLAMLANGRSGTSSLSDDRNSYRCDQAKLSTVLFLEDNLLQRRPRSVRPKAGA